MYWEPPACAFVLNIFWAGLLIPQNVYLWGKSRIWDTSELRQFNEQEVQLSSKIYILFFMHQHLLLKRLEDIELLLSVILKQINFYYYYYYYYYMYFGSYLYLILMIGTILTWY